MRLKLFVALAAVLALCTAATAGARTSSTRRKNTWQLSRGIFNADFRVVPNHSGVAKTFFLLLTATSSAELGKAVATCRVPQGLLVSVDAVFGRSEVRLKHL